MCDKSSVYLVVELFIINKHKPSQYLPTMNADEVTKEFLNMKKIFRIAAVLQLTSHLWPQDYNIPDDSRYDFIVVGGGTAGCVVASRLLELKNITVLLIEAGGNPPWESSIPKHFMYLKHTMVDWNITATADKYHQNHKGGVIEIPQGKMLGGTSSLNHMIYEHGNSVEYTTWASLINSTNWIYDNLLPFFIKNEKVKDSSILSSLINSNLHGTKGKIVLRKYYYEYTKRYISAYNEMDTPYLVDINSKNPIGVTGPLFNFDRRSRQSTAYSFLRHVRNNPRLHVLKNALVTEILFDSRNTAIGVKVRTSNKKVLVVMSNIEIIISAGVFKTPQLLMLSGIGPAKHLSSKNIKVRVDLPVGRNLQDSPTVLTLFKMGQLKRTSMMNTKDPNDLMGLPLLSGAIAAHRHESFPDYSIQGFIIEDSKLFFTLCLITLGYTKQLCEKLCKEVDGKIMYLTLHKLAYPISRGRLYLANKNMEDQPIINLGFYDNSSDLNVHAMFLEHHNTILNTSQFERVGAEFVDPKLSNCRNLRMESNEYWKCYALSMVTTSYNIHGTCSMGSVVDSNFLVKGTDRLRVVDASIIPTTITSPLLAAVVMIAEKASDLIKTKIKKSFNDVIQVNRYKKHLYYQI